MPGGKIMREIEALQITQTVKQLCMSAAYHLGDDVLGAIRDGLEKETSPTGRDVLNQLLENAEIAGAGEFPLCQDCGLAVIFVELGQEVHVTGGDLNEAIHEGVRQGYEEAYLRKSVCHPFTRKNTGDNTPSIIHVKVVPGERIKLTMAAKGGGSENMSRVMMLKPSDGKEGIMNYVIERVKESGPNPCPPTIVGVGIGGTYERAALIAKEALLRPVGRPSLDPELAEMEAKILDAVNGSGIGPAGLGGRITSFAVHIEMRPCHIASLPVAVNINCHSHRHKEAVI
ncbi:MAG: fumarate hydratase [Deltaproteobacteria bacterium]|nr:fumarate hydratase [Deltaproteobacteria bacterium]